MIYRRADVMNNFFGLIIITVDSMSCHASSALQKTFCQFSPRFDVICDLLLNRCNATWKISFLEFFLAGIKFCTCNTASLLFSLYSASKKLESFGIQGNIWSKYAYLIWVLNFRKKIQSLSHGLNINHLNKRWYMLLDALTFDNF